MQSPSVGTRRSRLSIYGPYFSYSRAHDRTAALIPLGLYRKDRSRSFLAAMPLIYYRNDFREQQRSWVLGPFYARRYRDGWAGGAFPLLFVKNRPARRTHG